MRRRWRRGRGQGGSGHRGRGVRRRRIRWLPRGRGSCWPRSGTSGSGRQVRRLPVEVLGHGRVARHPGGFGGAARRRARERRAHRQADLAAAALAPVAGLHDHVEHGRGQGAADPDQADLHPEEVDLLVGAVVEPVQAAPELLVEPGRDPDHHGLVQPRGVHDHLAELVVVGGLQAVLDHDGPAGGVGPEHVEGAGVDVDLLLQGRDVDPEGLAEQVDVLEEPGRQVGQLLAPERLEVQPLEPAEAQPLDLRSGHSRSFRSPPRSKGSCTPAR